MVLPERSQGSPNRKRQLAVCVGAVAILLWGIWWAKSRIDGRLYGRTGLWVPALDFLGGDFVVHIDHTARTWAEGHDPYRLDDPVCSIFPYPPMIPRLFAWVSLVSTSTARDIWMVCLAAILASGAIVAARTRRELNLTFIPAALAVPLLLLSTPAIFVLERGQCDPLVLPLVIASSVLLGRNNQRSEIVAGFLIALACWIKYYPGLAIIGLMAMRRWRALAACCTVGLVMGIYDFPWVMRSLENCGFVVKQFAPSHPWVLTVDHSLSYGWPSLWHRTVLKPLRFIPGTIAAILVLGPIIGLVSSRIYRLPRAAVSKVSFPYLLWLVALATFFPPIANDYNLVLLPLAALCVYDSRDRPLVHILMAYLLLWWQPFKLPISGGLLLTFKVAGCWAVGLSLIARAREFAEPSGSPSLALVGFHRRHLTSTSQTEGHGHVQL